MENTLEGLRRLLQGEAAPGLPVFCLERWQSLHETRAKVLLSESGVEPPSASELKRLGVDLSLGEVDLGYGWTVGDPRLRSTIARTYYGGLVPGDNVIVTTGSAEANLLSVLALVGPGDRVVVDMPNYMQIPGLLKLRGARIFEAWRSRDGWSHDPAELLGLVRRVKPRAIFITNPNNPTGSVMGRSLVWELAREASRAGSLLVFDEVYRGLEHSTGPEPTVLEAAMGEGAEAVSVSGLSKAFGLPGLRIGWATSTSSGLVERLWMVKDYTTISPARPSEVLALRVLESGAWRLLSERARRIVSSNLERLLSEASRIGARVYRPLAGAFALIEVGGDGLEAAYRLYTRLGVLVNPGECFRVPGSLRLGLGMADTAGFGRVVGEVLRFLYS